MSGVPYSLSLSDLYLIDNFKEVFDSLPRNTIHWPNGPEKEFVMKTLYENGMLTHDVEVSEPINHRNLRNQVVLCSRIEGFERCDEQWLRSGCASLDAVIAGCQDFSLRSTLKEMSKTSDATKTDENLENSAKKELHKIAGDLNGES